MNWLRAAICHGLILGSILGLFVLVLLLEKIDPYKVFAFCLAVVVIFGGTQVVNFTCFCKSLWFLYIFAKCLFNDKNMHFQLPFCHLQTHTKTDLAQVVSIGLLMGRSRSRTVPSHSNSFIRFFFLHCGFPIETTGKRKRQFK
ncbi:hypothetical protein QQ045_000534 [Rhodiola kirilowii]